MVSTYAAIKGWAEEIGECKRGSGLCRLNLLKKNSTCFKIEFFHRKGIIDRQAIEIFPLSFSDMQAQGDINQRIYASWT